MNSADTYTSRARIQPALIITAPLGLLLLALIPDYPLIVTVLIIILGPVGGSAVVAQVGRDPGRKKERALWESWGGPPTTRLLRHHRDPADDLKPTPGIRQQVEKWLGSPLPTEQKEKTNPKRADEAYERATLALREATRDQTKFPLVFDENVSYGFRRNMWGLRPFGASIAVGVALFSWMLLLLTILGRPWPDPWWAVIANADSTVLVRLLVTAVNTVFAAFWIFWVRRSWVRTAANAYARRLMESVRTLRNDWPERNS